MKKSAQLIWVLLLIVLCGAIGVFESGTRYLRRTYDDLILDNRNHYLSCDRLPSEAEVRRAMQAHQETLDRIENVNPGFVGVEVDTSTCPGRADILFWYGTHQNRLQIEDILAGDTFFGIPFRLQNR